MEDIKKAIIGIITLAITTGGGLLIKSLFEGEEEETVVEKTIETAPQIIINIPQQEVKKDTIVKKIYIKPKKTEKITEKLTW